MCCLAGKVFSELSDGPPHPPENAPDLDRLGVIRQLIANAAIRDGWDGLRNSRDLRVSLLGTSCLSPSCPGRVLRLVPSKTFSKEHRSSPQADNAACLFDVHMSR